MRFRKKQEEERIEFPTENEEEINEDEIQREETKKYQEERPRSKTRKNQEESNQESEINIQELFDLAIGNLERTYLALVELRKRIK